MPDVKAVDSLPWQPGGRPCKYSYIYERLTAPADRWYVVEFGTVEEARRARAAVRRHGVRQGWALKTSQDGYRLGVKRVA